MQAELWVAVLVRMAAVRTVNSNRSGGYAVASLEAALWCFHTTSTFETAVLEAANLGDDADTTAAIVAGRDHAEDLYKIAQSRRQNGHWGDRCAFIRYLIDRDLRSL
jgi:ADP-ribosylglycohydrolase